MSKMTPEQARDVNCIRQLILFKLVLTRLIHFSDVLQLAQMQRQAASMDPAQMRQAMNMLNNMTPEQRRSVQEAAANLPPETLVQQASTAQQNLTSHQKYQYDASMQLKAEGNKLHSLKKFREAAEKYQQAIQNLTAHASEQSIDLRLSCQSNLASCFLQLGSFHECVSACDGVLTNAVNRKALYRRGQALAALGRVDEAIRDLHKALELSPEAEKSHIAAKLDEVKDKQRQASLGIILEESHGTNEEGTAEEETRVDEFVSGKDRIVENVTVEEEGAWPSRTPLTELQPPTSIGQPPPEQVQRAAELIRQDPEMVRRTADMVAGMSDAELAAHLSQAVGIPAVTPEMAKAAASMMKSMPPEQIQDMAAKAATMQGNLSSGMTANGGFDGSNAGIPPIRQMPAVPSAEAAAEMFKRDPESLKTAAKMIQTLPAEHLQAMAAAMPGTTPAGMPFDPEQMRTAAKMMENMSIEEFERMTKLAQSMGMPLTGAGSDDGALPPLAGTATESRGTAESIPPASVPGAAPRFDPGSMNPGAFNAMRRQMDNPEMLRSMQNMLKGMDPESLASMMRVTGMDMTAEQAQRMVDSMANVSDRQLEWLARLSALINQIIDVYQKARAWVRNNTAVALAILALVLYLVLKWLGWV